MTAPVHDQVVAPLADALLECLRAEVAKVADPPAKVELRPGVEPVALIAASLDECCAGLALVQPGLVYPSTAAFPVPDPGPHRCALQWAVTLSMAVLRCAPVGDAQTLPSADAWASTTLAVLDDGAAMRRAICCFTALPLLAGRRWLIGTGQPLPVEGACTGSSYMITVSAPACDCPDAG
jgi:hypothetical protein